MQCASQYILRRGWIVVVASAFAGFIGRRCSMRQATINDLELLSGFATFVCF